MAMESLFRIHLVLGYVAWLLCFGAYVWPWLKSMDRVEAHRAIATLHSFRFFGLVFILPGVVSPDLPAGFAVFAAWGDFATGVLAMLALLAVRVRLLFWPFRRRLQCRRNDRPRPKLLQRHPDRPSRARRVAGRRLCDPDHLRAAADDHARRRIHSSGMPSGGRRRDESPMRISVQYASETEACRQVVFMPA